MSKNTPARRLLFFSSIALFAGTAAVACSPAWAQELGYGALQQLFGEPVTTSATGTPQRATDVPISMIIVTADDIRRSGARDIPGVLQHVIGVDVLQWGSDAADVSIRGYDQALSARVLVLIDGRQVYADHYNFVPWSALPVELSQIRQIEIVEGPNAALFGFNAVGGVINIITYNPRYDSINTASADGGTQGLAEGSGVTTFHLDSIGTFRLAGGMRTDDGFGTPLPQGTNDVPRTANQRYEINGVADFNLADDVTLTLSAAHSFERDNDVGPYYAQFLERVEADSLMANLAADTDFGLIKFSIYNNWLTIHSVLPPFGAPTFDNRITVARAEDMFNLGTSNTLRFAFEYRNTTMNLLLQPQGDIFYDVLSASAMWDWHVTPSLSLVNAVRGDRLSLRTSDLPAVIVASDSVDKRKFEGISFNSGLVWKADDIDTFRLTASCGEQLPSLTEFNMQIAQAPIMQLLGLGALQPTEVTNYEASWNRDLPVFDSRLQVGFFRQQTTDVRSFIGGFFGRPIPGYTVPFYLIPENIGSSNADGVELRANGDLDQGWRWSFGYRAEILNDHFAPFAVDGRSPVDFEHTTPEHMVKAGLGWSDAKWETDAYVNYQSNTFGLRPAPQFSQTTLVAIPNYVSVDGRVAYKFTDSVTLAVSGQNLLQSPQEQTSGPKVARQVFATLSFNF